MSTADLVPLLAQRKSELRAIERQLADVANPEDQKVMGGYRASNRELAEGARLRPSERNPADSATTCRADYGQQPWSNDGRV